MTPGPFDAWVLARLMAGLTVGGVDLVPMSPVWRRLADRLAIARSEQRAAMLDGYLAGRPDGDAIVIAVANSDPTGPPPLSVEAHRGATAAGTAAAAASPVTTAQLIRAADITPRDVEWLWSGRVPLGMLSLWSGDPKLGKSYASLGLAAAVSRGAPMPHGAIPDGPASVVLMSAEDDPARVIVPRLEAAGADLERIHIVESVILANGSLALPSLRADMAAIEAAASRLGDCRLIVIDPVSSYLGGTDDHRNTEIRGVLSPLKEMAEALNLAVVLVTHLSKSGGTNGKHRVIGSIAYVGACRANMLFTRDRSDPTGRRVLMLDNGGNLAPPAPTLSFVIEDRGDGPRVEWCEGTLAITAEQALAADLAACQPDQDAPERREAEQWLREMLAAGPVRAREIEVAARGAGFAFRTLERAKKGIGAESVRKGFGKESTSFWRLADASNS